MAIAVRQDVKDYFKIETTAQDTLIDTLLARAKAKIAELIGVAVTTETVTWYDDVMSHRLSDPVTKLILKRTPVDASSIVVKDVDAVVVPATDYTVRQDVGLIDGKSNVTFQHGPYTIEGNVGLQHAPRYATVVEPFLNQALIDLVGFYLQQRTPGASSESAAGTSTGFVYGIDYGGMDATTGLPKRILSDIMTLRGPMVTT